MTPAQPTAADVMLDHLQAIRAGIERLVSQPPVPTPEQLAAQAQAQSMAALLQAAHQFSVHVTSVMLVEDVPAAIRSQIYEILANLAARVQPG